MTEKFKTTKDCNNTKEERKEDIKYDDNNELNATTTTTTTTTTIKEDKDDDIEKDITTTTTTCNNNNDNLNSNLITLDSIFIYQNNITGKVLPNHQLSIKQLCRILCPPTTTTTTSITIQHRHITSNTNVLLIDNNNNQNYNQQQQQVWKQIHEIPILQEATIQWYYYSYNNTTKTQQNEVVGPISCRQLYELQQQQQQQQQQQDVDKSNITSYYSSTITDNTWKQLHEIPNLQYVFDAFKLDDNNHNKVTTNNVNISDTIQQSQQGSKVSNDNYDDDIQRELEMFLSKHKNNNNDDDDEEEEEEAYESDGGTKYIKDTNTGNWVHEALIKVQKDYINKNSSKSKNQTANTTSSSNDDNTNSLDSNNNKRKRKKSKNKKTKFANRYGRCWVYVSGLPNDCTENELIECFTKFGGILDIHPETQKPKIKLYRYKDGPNIGQLKGDASICYARPESVQLAISLLNDTPLRYNNDKNSSIKMKVQNAKFQQHGDMFQEENKPKISNAKRKVAKLATKQAIDWDDNNDNGRLTGGKKGLRIIVLKHVFNYNDFSNISIDEENLKLSQIEHRIRTILCEQNYGTIEKITFFTNNPDGIVIIKFTQPIAASKAIQELNGTSNNIILNNNNNNNNTKLIDASFWDGVTDYTIKKHNNDTIEEEENKRHEEFGKWLNEQSQKELPEELQLKIE